MAINLMQGPFNHSNACWPKLGQLMFVSLLEVQPTQIKLGQLTVSRLVKCGSRAGDAKPVKTITEKARETWEYIILTFRSAYHIWLLKTGVIKHTPDALPQKCDYVSPPIPCTCLLQLYVCLNAIALSDR